MTAPRYLLVKHVPDLERFEPRNVGVIVWTPWGVGARFLGDKADSPGEVDGRSIPEFVRSKSAYRQWVQYWHREIARDTLVPVTGGEAVLRANPNFVDALLSAGRGDYVVEDGGFILDPIQDLDIGSVVESLYGRLIEPIVPAQDDVKDPGLDELCTELIQASGIAENPYWQRSYRLSCSVATNLIEDFEFTYAFANGDVKRLYQRVPMATKKRVFARKAVHDCAWMFEKVISARRLTPEKCISLVYVAEQDSDPDTQKLLNVLSSVSRVINVVDRDEAMREFTEVQAEG